MGFKDLSLEIMHAYVFLCNVLPITLADFLVLKFEDNFATISGKGNGLLIFFSLHVEQEAQLSLRLR